ncbi:MAG: hypothetical protein ACHQ53_04805, partial [Polyangiales bacterium]
TASNAPVVYAELPGAQHAFDLFHSIRTHHAIAGIRRFLTWLIAHRAREADTPAHLAHGVMASGE